MSHTQSSSYPTVQQMGSGVNPMYSDSNTLSSMAAYYTQGGSTSQMLTPQQMIALAQSQGGVSHTVVTVTYQYGEFCWKPY